MKFQEGSEENKATGTGDRRLTIRTLCIEGVLFSLPYLFYISMVSYTRDSVWFKFGEEEKQVPFFFFCLVLSDWSSWCRLVSLVQFLVDCLAVSGCYFFISVFSIL